MTTKIDISTITSPLAPDLADVPATRAQYYGAKFMVLGKSGAFENTLVFSVYDDDGDEILCVRLDEQMRVALVQALLEG